MDAMVTRTLYTSLRHVLHPDQHEGLQPPLQRRRLQWEQNNASDRYNGAKLSVGILGTLGRLEHMQRDLRRRHAEQNQNERKSRGGRVRRHLPPSTHRHGGEILQHAELRHLRMHRKHTGQRDRGHLV